MPRKSDAATGLAEKMIRVLESQRGLGGDSYPLPLKRLAELADPLAPPALVEKALGKKAFARQALVAQKKNLLAPVALANDLEQLAASRALLEFALEAACSSEAPAQPLARLKAQLVPALKKPFEAAVHQQVRDDALPLTVGVVQVKRTTQLYLRRMPPPPPPKPPAVALAEKLLSVLETQRRLDAGSYPLTMKRLVELTAPPPAPAVLKKAMVTEPFRSQAVIAHKNKPEAPVALAADHTQLAASPVLLEFALASARTATKHAFTGSELKKKVIPELQQPFEAAVNQQVETARLPPSVGWIWLRKKLLFLVSDVNGGRPVAAPASAKADEEGAAPGSSASTAADFAKAFDEAFYWLDRRAGSHNFVSLVDLRRAVPFDRDTFDTELRRLRRANRYILSAAEGRHGLDPEEQQAGITEDGTLLLYVSRRSP
jgi:hypothetical protein